MTQVQNFVWPIGEDLNVQLRYKEGPTEATATIVNLSSGFAVRMDIVIPATKLRIYTFNSAAIADVDPLVASAQPDNTLEGVLTAGTGETPNIDIKVPRSILLPGGPVYDAYVGVPSVTMFNYDVFLRNTGTDRQSKILKGSITIEESYTLWV